jgi:[glutamine synthetase] adenylyltransferase / [glutamine synthetase]-adenylyl-L-tyrosine phosphorylase
LNVGQPDETGFSAHWPPAPRTSLNQDVAMAHAAAGILLPHLNITEQPSKTETLAESLSQTARTSLNSHRALTLLSQVASSLDKTSDVVDICEDNLHVLVRLCGASEFFGEMVAGNPTLISFLRSDTELLERRDFRASLRAAINSQRSFSSELSAFRRQWARLLVEIGALEAAEELSVFESNRLQTELAIASLNVACFIARRELTRRYGKLASSPRIAIFGLGRLGTGGVDYGSDLDLNVVYDPLVSSPVASLTPDEAYARLVELMIAALSSITREGYLYRIDLRLRPNGKNGPLVTSSQSFLDYLKDRADIWEWLAYVKLRAVAGDLEFGKMVETHARHAIHERASSIESRRLQEETRRVRDRLEREKGRRGRHGGIDIKYSAGGMLDVYFATRYLQLRDDLPDEGDDRSTRSTLDRLEAAGSLDPTDYQALSNGYALLRSVDHHLRLLLGKSARLPATEHPALQDIARKIGFQSSSVLAEKLGERMRAIREAYDRITESMT